MAACGTVAEWLQNDVHGEAKVAEGTGGAADTAFVSGSGVAKSSLHLWKATFVRVGDPGEGDAAVAIRQQ